MIGPALQCTPHLVGILCALIHSRYPTAMVGVVVEDRFNVVRLYAEFAKLCCAGAPKIVETPRGDPDALIQFRLGSIPILVALLIAEQKLRRIASRLALDDCQGLAR